MRFVIEATADEFKALEGADVFALSVPEIEIRQEGDKASQTKRVASIVMLGGALYPTHGIETGPAIQVFTGLREEQPQDG